MANPFYDPLNKLQLLCDYLLKTTILLLPAVHKRPGI